LKNLLLFLLFVVPSTALAQTAVVTTAADGPTALTRALVGTWECNSQMEEDQKAGTKIEIVFGEDLSDMTILRDKKVDEKGKIEDVVLNGKPSKRYGTSFSLNFSSGETDKEEKDAFWLGKLVFSLSGDKKTLSAGEFHQGFEPWVDCTKEK
jgi:hypothetical protein